MCTNKFVLKFSHVDPGRRLKTTHGSHIPSPFDSSTVATFVSMITIREELKNNNSKCYTN